jgi:glucose/mannose-6-phosphate isomerase
MGNQKNKCIEEELRDLDRDETFKVDRFDMYSWIQNNYKMLTHGLTEYIGKLDPVVPSGKSIREVLVCGMGGSAIAGDLANVAVQNFLPVPYSVVKSYQAPNSIGEGTLQIIISYSGNTEESIWAYTQGHNRGANIVVITAGGALEELASLNGYPCIMIPPDCPAPRLALGYLVTAALAVLDNVFHEITGIDEIVQDAIISVKRGVKKFEKALPLQKNFTKQLAVDIHKVCPVVIGSDITWPAALRFQTQLNENAKWPCHASRLPEMDHNEIVAYSHSGPATSRTGIILMRDKDDHVRTQLRQDFTIDLLENSVAWIKQLKGEGKNCFARVCNLIQAADFTSYYLACARGLDPFEIQAISSLKDRLGKIK